MPQISGDDQINFLFGSEQPDTILGLGGGDIIFGLGGADVITAGSGNDLVDAGSGNDTITGGAQNDTLIGNTGDDVIDGGEGDDLLVWNEGDGSDTLEGGDGDDRVQVNGASGADESFEISDFGGRVALKRTNTGPFILDIGTAETLEVNGLDGDDIIDAAALVASLINLDLDGGGGNDQLIGSGGGDTLFGNAGRDTLEGRDGDDVLLGDDGKDSLVGGDGVDMLYGGADGDTLTGGGGNDLMVGGGGNDVLIWNDGDGSDDLEGGDGYDFVQVNGAADASDAITISAAAGLVNVERTNLDPFSLAISSAEILDVNGQGGDDTVDGSDLDAGLIKLDLDGGDGNDSLIGGDGADMLRGGSHNDVLIGGLANDVMLGEDGDDLVIWNDGDGSDIVEGGDGTDRVQVNGASLGDTFEISGNDGRILFERNSPAAFSLDIGSVETLQVNGLDGDDVIDGSNLAENLIDLDFDGGGGNDVVYGGDGGDMLRGGSGDDLIGSARGNDVMQGDAGNDTLIWWGGVGSVRMDGGDGNDSGVVYGALTADDLLTITADDNRVIVARANVDPFTLDIGTTETLDINGRGGDDTLSGSGLSSGLINLDLDGGSGDDSLIGSLGADMLRGGDDDDVLDGDKGNDVIQGEAGDDLMIYENGDGSDVMEGGDGNDTVQVNGSFLYDDDMTVSVVGERVLFERSNLIQFSLDIGSTESLFINGFQGNDQLELAAGSNFATAGVTHITFVGGAGNDAFNAGSTTIDIDVNGGDGADILFGGTGASTLTGGNGADLLIGGTNSAGGRDVFRYTNVSEGTDNILGFQRGQDKLLLDGVLDGFDADSNPADYLRLTDIAGFFGQLEVNADGQGNDFVTLTYLQGSGFNDISVLLPDIIIT